MYICACCDDLTNRNPQVAKSFTVDRPDGGISRPVTYQVLTDEDLQRRAKGKRFAEKDERRWEALVNSSLSLITVMMSVANIP